MKGIGIKIRAITFILGVKKLISLWVVSVVSALSVRGVKLYPRFLPGPGVDSTH